jgi:hypothetical protein
MVRLRGKRSQRVAGSGQRRAAIAAIRLPTHSGPDALLSAVLVPDIRFGAGLPCPQLRLCIEHVCFDLLCTARVCF